MLLNTRPVAHAALCWVCWVDLHKYYVVRGSKYVVGHLLDFRAGQNNGVARDASTGESGVAELPVELFTAGGSTAPVDTALLESQQAEAVGTPG